MLVSILILLAAIALLYFGAEFSLEASEKIGKKLGMSPLLIGMLLVGFGTSLPELFVGHIASLKGNSGIALGSLVGSNVANTFLILGICAFVSKLSLQNLTLRPHLWIHLLLALALAIVLQRASIDYVAGGILLAVIFIYLFYIFKEMKEENIECCDHKLTKEESIGNPVLVSLKMFLGFFMLYLGGEFLVKSSSDICVSLGVSEYIISAIFVAFGTSFPELVTALVASIKKKDTDLIVGNIVGSNLFNCAFILGSLSYYRINIAQSFLYEICALAFGSVILVLIAYTSKSFFRKTGFLFLCTYAAMVLHWLKFF